MNRTRAASLIACAVFLFGCGGGGGGGDDPPEDGAPTVANLRYTPSSALQLPGETATVTGSLDFTDTGANVAELRLSLNGGTPRTLPVRLPAGRSATVQYSFPVALDRLGRAAFELWLVDDAGQASNRLAGTFDVQVNDAVPRWRPAPGQDALARVLNARWLRAGAWTGSRYVFVGQLVVTSPDLVSWTERSLPADVMLESIAWSGSAFVAAGARSAGDHDQAVVLHSSDGTSWAVREVVDRCPEGAPEPPCTYQAGLSKVIWAGTQFVAVGRETVPGSGDVALILTSPDGLTWTQRARDEIAVGADVGTPLSTYGLGMSSVAWSGQQFVAVGRGVGGGAAVWTSPDARSWTARTAPAWNPFTLRDVAWGHGRFVAVGWGGLPPPVAVLKTATITSTDGVHWLANEGSLPLSVLKAVGVGPGHFLTASTTEWHTSTDGRQWLTTPSVSAGGSQAAFWDGRRWVGVGLFEVQVSP